QLFVAIEGISGIITTNLGKTATFSKVAGRERRVHHSKSLPLLLIGERFFFALTQGPGKTTKLRFKPLKNSPF
ncbi:MAG: hypothetical protein KJO33_05555, partial [Gammaproteobacteria bacterium]|nr:hypothetical protein [Gammaproteobacteria bacterium]